MRPPVDQIVDLHQIDPLRLQQLERVFHLRDAGVASARPHLGGDERLRMRVRLREQIARDSLGPAIHR